MPLTETQRNLVTQNERLVYRIVTNMGLLNDEDAIQEGFRFLCLASMRYKSGAGVKFSTFAYSYIKGGILTYLNHNNVVGCRREGTKNIPFVIKDIDDESIFSSLYIDTTKDDEFKDLVDMLMLRVDDMTKIILQMFSDGYTQQEISKKLGVSQPYISRKISRIKKDKEILNEFRS